MNIIYNLKTLYEIDDSLWLEENIKLLKTKQFDKLDLENLIEELEDLGSEKKHRTAKYIAYLWEGFALCSPKNTKHRYLSR